MYRKIVFLLCFCVLLGACAFKTSRKQQEISSFPAKVQNFAYASSVFKVDLEENLGQNSNLLLLIDYDAQNDFYTIKIVGAFASVLLKAKYDLNTFTYDYKPAFLENKQAEELFEQTVKVLLGQDYLNKFKCSLNKCELVLGGEMFKNKYIFSAYNQEGFAGNIFCSYRRGLIKFNLNLLKIKLYRA